MDEAEVQKNGRSFLGVIKVACEFMKLEFEWAPRGEGFFFSIAGTEYLLTVGGPIKKPIFSVERLDQEETFVGADVNIYDLAEKLFAEFHRAYTKTILVRVGHAGMFDEGRN